MNSGNRTVCAILILFNLLLVVGCTAARKNEAPVKGKIVAKSLKHKNVARDYYVHLPSGYTKDKSWPVLFLLHGAGGGTADLPYDPAFSKYGFIGVYPQGIDKRWNDGRKEIFHKKGGGEYKAYDDVGFVGKMIDQMVSEYNVDPTRVYVSGMSNGGLMTPETGEGTIFTALPRLE